MSALEKLKSAFVNQTKAAAAVGAAIEEVRGAVIAKANALHQLRAMPIPQAEAEAILDKEIARHVEAAGRAVARAVGGLTLGKRGALNLDPTPDEAVSLQIAMNPQGFRKMAVAELTSQYKGREAMPRDQRAARIAEVEAELLDLETTEEAMIRQAERAGLEILRRANADPRAVLALIEG